MGEWKKVLISSFLQSRPESYDPSDLEIINLRRLEKIDFDGNIHLSDKSTRTKMIIIQPGDLVISGINVAKGAIAVYEGLEPITATIHYSSYKFDPEKIDIQYFKRFLKSDSFLKALKEQVRGGIKTEIKAKDFLPIQINLPSIDLQRKINLHFDSFEHELSDLNKELKNQSNHISLLRKTILQEAIEGKLTADWRKQNPVRKGDPNTDAAALLEKIKLEKEKMIAEGKIKREKPLEPIKPEEIPFELPEGWIWCQLGEIAQHSLGKMLDKAKNRGEYKKYLRNLNVRWFEFDLSDMLEMRFREEEREQYTAIKGDVLICEGGYPGRAAIWMDNEPIYFQKAIHRVRFYLKELNKWFLYFLFLSDLNRDIEKYFTGSGIQHFTGKELHRFLMPLPPLAEQRFIVAQIDRLLVMVDELEQQVKDRQGQAEDLMQAVLREAFESPTRP